MRPILDSGRISRAAGLALAFLLPAAALASPPARVQVTNLTDQAFTVHWFTNQAVTGQIHWGTSAGALTNTAEDIRGATTSGKLHYAAVTGLTGSTAYFFKVVSAGVEYGDPAAGNAAYQITTGAPLNAPPASFASGVVREQGGGALTAAVVVVARLQDANGAETSGTSLPLSSLVTDAGGQWVFGNTDFRTSDGSANFSFHASADQLLVAADGGPLGTASSTEPTSRFVNAFPFDIQNTLALPSAPTVTAVAPASGDRSGTTNVTLTGTNFLFATAARLSDAAPTSLTNVVATSETTITGTVPAGVAAGTYNVLVTNPGGANTTSAQQFTVTQGAPSVTTVAPAAGDNDAATNVTLTGANFTGATAVRLADAASTALTSVVVVSDTQITAVVPAGVVPNGTAGYDVRVTAPGGSNTTSAQRFVPTEGNPTVTNITPSQAPNNQATSITVAGTNFLGVRTSGNVRINNTLLTGITVSNDATMTATVPTGITPGTYNLIVTNTNGANTASTPQFTVSEPAPTVSAVSPSSGAYTSTTNVTITGANFLGVTGARLSDAANTSLTNVVIVSATSITATVPANVAPGTYDVRVTNSGGTNQTSTQRYTVTEPAPTVTALNPATGDNDGPTAVTLTGTGFLGATAVRLADAASTALTSVVVVNSTTITATIPAGVVPNGTTGYDVRVTNSNSTNTTSTQKFVPTEGLPTVTNIVPATGANNTTTSVTVTGTNFLGVRVTADVKINNIALTGITVASDTSLTATVPSGITPGSYNLIVTNSAGANAASTPQFVVTTPPPTVSGVTPSTGANTGTTNVSITGANFLGATAVRLSDAAGTALTNVVVVSATQITATVPAGVAPGALDVRVTTSGGTNTTSTGKFTVTEPAPTVTAVNPATGDNDTGTSVTITGTNLLGTTAVRLSDAASTALTNVVVVSATSLTATVPAGVVPLGSGAGYDIRVTNTNSTNTLSDQDFVPTETSPTVTGITPGQGPNDVTTAITVTGTNFLGVRTTGNVRVNGVALTGITVASDTSLTATVPVGLTPGTYNLIVTNTNGANGASNPQFVVTEPVPKVTQVSPASGLNTGTTDIVITGDDFLGATNVQLATTPRTTLVFTIQNVARIDATVPAGLTPGTYRVVVTNTAGESTENTTFQVTEPAPTVTDVAPANGVNTAATDVTITGTAFLGATGASLRSGATTVALTNFANPGNGTTVTARVPAGVDPGTYTVAVTNSAGANSTGPTFTVSEVAPTVGAVTPGTGRNDVATSITITGTGFLGADNAGGGVALVGTTTIAITGFTVVGDTQITASVPAGQATGTYAVRVTNTAGTSAGAVTFTVTEPLAAITSVTPATGINTGAVDLTIDGANFGSATVARLSDAGATALTNFAVVSATRITATVPAGVARGAYDILITNSGGTPTAATVRYTVTAPPVASAGNDAAGPPGGYRLDGSASADPDGGTLTFAWNAAGGNPAAVQLQNATSAAATFTASVQGAYTFTLTVTDPTGAAAADAVVVTINNVTPVADAGADLTLATGGSGTLDGSASADANGAAGLTYAWTVNPGTATLGTAAAAATTFTSNAAGVYTATLTVSDGTTQSVDTVRVEVLSATVVPPMAHAGVDTYVFLPAFPVQLSGRDSVDPDVPAGALTYTWTASPGNPAGGILTGANTETPVFTPGAAGTYEFTLVVRDAADDGLDSAPDTVTVFVDPAANPQPTAVPTVAFTDTDGDGQIDAGEPVAFSGTGSVNPDGAGTLVFTWTQVEGPEFNLNGATTATPDFTALSPGTYTFELVVNDGTTPSAPVPVTIQVLPAGAPATVRPPAADARANGTAGAARIRFLPGSAAITLSGAASQDNDGDGTGLTHRWEQLQGPTVALTGSDTATCTFSPLVSRTYIFRLTVTDSNGLRSASDVTVVVDTYDPVLNPTGNDVPTAVVSAPATVAVGSTVTLDASGSSDPVDGDPVTASTGLLFFWTQTSGPIVNLDRTNPMRPTFIPAVDGTYSFTLYVDDGADLSPGATTTLQTGAVPGGGTAAGGSSRSSSLGGNCWAQAAGGAPAGAALALAAALAGRLLRRRRRGE